jgi:RNA polymerase sigma factor (sigma-70 family)
MATNRTGQVIRHLRQAVLRHDGAGITDGQLLGCFVERRDEAAFAALVKRHGPMVWGVCRRLLPHHDAEDAFQAAFLVLVRKAASVVPREMVANWLYGVAHQTALQARRTTARRGARERQVTPMPEPAVAEQDPWHDLRPLLDRELACLPDTYRAAIVLCDLGGKTRKEAARQLGCPEGTLAARLARGRAMLAKRLARNGLALSAGTLAAVLAQQVSASVPASVVSATVRAGSLVAAGRAAAVSAKVAALAEGVLKAMLLTRLKVVVMLFVVAGLTGAAGLIYQTQATERPKALRATERANKETQPLAAKQEVVPALKGAEKGVPANAETAGKNSPKEAKKEQKVLTPEEAVEQRPREKVTVQFKVSAVEVTPLDGPRIEGYPEGPHIRLKDGGKFSVLLMGPATDAIRRLDIVDEADKHFNGKVVRVTGQVQPDHGEGPPFSITVDDLNHFEVVKD